LRTYKSKLEIWAVPESETKTRTLLLRDNIILSSPTPRSNTISARMDHHGIFGTLVLLGPLFTSLGAFFLSEFALLPRIGGRDWGDAPTTSNHVHPTSNAEAVETEKLRLEQWRRQRWKTEKDDGVLWTAARVRGCVVVKFAAREVEGAREWLGGMWREEGTVGREFGEGGLMCVR